MTPNDLEAVCRRHIDMAGPRYAPGVDAAAPSLQIPGILQTFDGLAYSSDFRIRVKGLRDELLASWKRCPPSVKKVFERRTHTPESVAARLGELSARQPGDPNDEIRDLPRASGYLGQSIDTIAQRLREKERSATRQPDRLAASSDAFEVRKLRRAVAAVESYVDSPGFRLLAENCLFLSGQWGTGKTHLLCDITTHRLKANLPTLLVLASHLSQQGGSDPLVTLCWATGLARSSTTLLQELQRLGEENDTRSLLLIDGINEGSRRCWRSALEGIASTVGKYPNVGFTVSCRSPFDREILTDRAAKKYVQIEHHGFEDAEFDAQLEFFDYYDIPAPTLPLLTPEFSRPLFLKLLCEAVSGLQQRGKHQYLRDIAAGQKGMTHVLEHFAKGVGRPIERQFGLPENTCWNILKGVSPSQGQTYGVAPKMATELREYISPEECTAIVRAVSGLSQGASERFVDRLVAEGLLVRQLHWESDEGEYREVFRFPYQRFGDHLIARHLLRNSLNTSTDETIRRSFYRDRPLGKIFALDEWGKQYSEPGLANAVMLEFPERVKRVAPENRRELVDYLPKHCRTVGALREPFLEGLHWRSVEAFTPRTDELVALFLVPRNVWATTPTLEILLTLAARPTHPYGASRFSSYLADLSMPERDLLWSEYLRYADDHSVVYRLIEWIEGQNWNAIASDAAINSIRLLSLMLTSTIRKLRDRVTRALFAIGLAYPEVLFERTLKCLGYNDPYVPERMLAACYGVAMSHWADPSGKELRAVLPEFGRALVRSMFLPDAPHPTWHILMQEYALGCVELAQKVQPRCIATQYGRYIKRPFDKLAPLFPPAEEVKPAVLDQTEPAIHMDFGNYTLGSLVPDRGNYDFENPAYIDVRKQILWRMAGLGYDSSLFEDADQAVMRGRGYMGRAANGGKTDRYSKKYSWIAFFEMWGWRFDQRKLPDWRMEHRTAECDLDPSFPPTVAVWNTPIEDHFKRSYEGPRAWLAEGVEPSYDELVERDTVDAINGPWILLDGYISESPGDPRELFTFMRGVLVRNEDVGVITEALKSTPYPGNAHIPEIQDDHYTFAGEIPWSSRFGTYLRDGSGRAQRNLESAFRATDSVTVEIPVHRYAWESHHSELNTTGSVLFPAPALCESLGLVNHEGTLDLFDGTGKRATVYRSFNAGRHTDSCLLYIRRDLLETYLSSTRQRIVWIIWGERTLEPDEFSRHEDELLPVLRSYKHVHSRLVNRSVAS